MSSDMSLPELILVRLARRRDERDPERLSRLRPDDSGRWQDAHRLRLLAWVARRDGNRCGLCAADLPRDLSQCELDHIIPRVYAYFDVTTRGRAAPGDQWASRMHHRDNLQAAHSNCNGAKRATSDLSRWRHPLMLQVPAAEARTDKPPEFLQLPLHPRD